MSKIELSTEEQNELVNRIQAFFRDEMKQEIEQPSARSLLEFFTEEIGPSFYNRAVVDAQAVLENQLDTIREGLEAVTQAGSKG